MMVVRRAPEPLDEWVQRRFGMRLDRFPEAVVESLDAAARVVDEDEMTERVMRACCVGETMLLRHREHFEALLRLAPELPRVDGVLRVWSAGCATGEEAWSMAGTLLGLPGGFEILGTDLNPAFVERARRGRYTAWSLRGTEGPDALSWIEEDGRGYRISDRLRDKVRFEVLNLCSVVAPQRFSAIFCRNVLLYFSPDKAAEVIASLRGALMPGGVLVLGYSDPWPAFGGPDDVWEEVMVGTTRLLRRPKLSLGPAAAGHDVAAKAEAPCEASATEAKRRVRRVSGRSSRRSSRRAGAVTRTGPAASGARRAAVSPAPSTDRKPVPKATSELPSAGFLNRRPDTLEVARRCAGEGRLVEASEVLARLSCERPIDPAVATLSAMVALEREDLTMAIVHARRAAFLRRDEPFPRSLLARALNAAGDVERAEVERRRALADLAAYTDPACEVACGFGITAGQLRRMIDHDG